MLDLIVYSVICGISGVFPPLGLLLLFFYEKIR